MQCIRQIRESGFTIAAQPDVASLLSATATEKRVAGLSVLNQPIQRLGVGHLEGCVLQVPAALGVGQRQGQR